ncbi:polysaccharide deacetylase family protein [Castellaniella sp. UC4442_H9]|jgi:peptidoglycan/xylan/chitin deacetylase (PgdA/CDA1 family)
MGKIGDSVRDRVPYVPIHKRKKLKLPGDGKIILWTIVNVENWRPQKPMPRVLLPPPMHQTMLPDLPNWAWHEYGMRVGFWRYLDALKSRDMRATLAINGSACKLYEEASAAAHEAGWEFIGHGYVQTPMHTVEDEHKAIVDTIQAIKDCTGKPPRGWESPGLTETDDTLDLLAEAGIEYVCNWPLDDQPVRMRTKTGRMTTLPYPVEINDVVMSAVQLQPSDEILRRGRDQFDRLYQESADSTRIMAISVHPFLTAVPHRIKYLEQLFDYILGHDGVVPMTGSEILDWYDAQVE